jgi:hypothetical protein
MNFVIEIFNISNKGDLLVIREIEKYDDYKLNNGNIENMCYFCSYIGFLIDETLIIISYRSLVI